MDARGVPRAQISRELGVSRNTVAKYAGMGDISLSPVNIMDSGVADFYAASMASGSAWRALSKRSKNSCMASAGTRSPMDSCGRKRL